MQRPEAKNPSKRPSISAETGNLKMGVKNPRRNGLFAVDVEICGFGRLDGGVRSQIRTGLRFGNSQLTGKLTGNFAILGPHKPISLHETTVLQRLFTKFPTQINRENILKNREFLSGNREFHLCKVW